MNYQHIRISELKEFAESAQCRYQKNLPVTHLRALSQCKNPAAASENVALIVAYNEKGEVVGYIGSLPGFINSSFGKQRIFWNNCWWVDADEGRQAAFQLLLRFIKDTGNHIAMTGFTDHSRQIIMNTSLFQKVAEYPSIRLFFRFYFSDKTNNPILKSLACMFDSTANILFSFYKYVAISAQKNVRYICLQEPDDEISSFIINFDSRQQFSRDINEIRWILKNPWLTVEKKFSDEAKKYFFSLLVKSHSQYFAKVFIDDKLIALILFSERDGHYQASYVYCEDQYLDQVSSFIIQHVLHKKAKSFYTHNPRIIDFINKNKKGTIHIRHTIEELVMTEDSKAHFNPDKWIQDGDGDCIFT